MRKFLLILAVALALPFMTNAQTIEESKFFDNTFVSLQGGVVTTNHGYNRTFFWKGAENMVKGLRPVVSFEIGKYVTPVVGFSVDGQVFINTTNSVTTITQHNIVLNNKFNISNLIGGYKGSPRKIEFVIVPGIGWGHSYRDVVDKNYLTWNASAEINVNLGKERRLQFNIKPGVYFNQYNTQALRLEKKNLNGMIRIGFTYKFGNFKRCPYTKTAEDYNALQSKYNDLVNRAPERVVETKEVEKVVEKEKVVEITRTAPFIVTFKIGSSKLSPVEKLKVERFAEQIGMDVNVKVIGSADTATGTTKINNKLAKERAEVVAKVLQDKGIKNVATEQKLDVDEVATMSRAAVVLVITE